MKIKLFNRWTLITFLILSAALIWFVVSTFFVPNVKLPEEKSEDSEAKIVIYIPSGSTLKQIDDILAPHLKNVSSYKRASKIFSWLKDVKVRSGKLTMYSSWSNRRIINAVRGNLRDEVRVTFNSLSSLEELASKVSQYIEADSASIMRQIKNEEFLEFASLDTLIVKAIFLPDTYFFYWDTSAEFFVNSMLKQYKNFWNEQRLEKAEKIGLTPFEVSILASIVQLETLKQDEQPLVAGLYLNRLKKNWNLQADPTVIYAMKQNGHKGEVRRVLFEDLKIKSPYNTYVYKGLPPAPICIPYKNSIDAVLDAEKHDYMYMCASVERPGYHEFAENDRNHANNRNKYRRWLNQRAIKR